MFKCYAMSWSNDKIRIYYNIPQVKGESRAIFTNTAKGPEGKKFLTRIKFSVEERVSAPLNVKSVAIVSLTYLIAMTKKHLR